MVAGIAKTGYGTGYEISGPSQTSPSGAVFGAHFVFNV
jgi:hypothetical protein